jgi:hypothetical protein
MSEPEPAPQSNIGIDPERMAGVYANAARVGHSPFEFTLDFMRLDFSTDPPNGIVVARVSVSPLFVQQLIDALDDNWAKYVDKAMPPEVRRHGGPGDSGDDPGQPPGEDGD